MCEPLIASEASLLVCSMARIFYIYICIFQAVRRAEYVLNVSAQCDIPQCKYKRATRKCNRLNELAHYATAATYVEHAFARPMLASY